MGKRGVRFFEEFSEGKKEETKGSRGRNTAMLQARNEKLVCRYYYFTRIVQLPYGKVLEALQNDFDLTLSTIPQLIDKLRKPLEQIAAKKITREQLRDKYPNFNWSDKTIELERKHKEVFVLK